MSTPRVLVVADYFLPGFRAGGPIRALANSMTRLAGQAVFSVVTRDHDTDNVPYPDVRSGAWSRGATGDVYYAPRLTRAVLERCVLESSADVIWLNSVFSRASLRVLLSRRRGRFHQPVLLAPRGELSPGALGLKRRRKALGLWVLREFGFLQGLHWIASSETERQEIQRFADAASIAMVPESVREVTGPPCWPAKRPGVLRMLFASRIDEKKNLQFLLEALQQCEGRIHLDVIGPIYVEMQDHWNACKLLIERMPANVTVDYLGGLPHEDLLTRLSHYDVMTLPTLGENFGHVIVEAWAAGCPVLISDRTPWRNLEADGVGWDVPLDRQAWVAALERCVAMTTDTHLDCRRRAVARAQRVWRDGLDGDATLLHLFATLATLSRVGASAPSAIAAPQPGS